MRPAAGGVETKGTSRSPNPAATILSHFKGSGCGEIRLSPSLSETAKGNAYSVVMHRRTSSRGALLAVNISRLAN